MSAFGLEGAPYLFSQTGTFAAPYTFTVPATLEVRTDMASATFDGTGAGGSFLPAISFYSPSGVRLGTFPCQGSAVAAGASAEVTWFPLGLAASAGTSSGGGIDFNKKNATAASGAAASYLWLDYEGTSPLTSSSYASQTDYGDLVAYSYNPASPGATGGMVAENNGTDGIVGLNNYANGYLPPWAFMTHIDGVPFSNANQKPRVGTFLGSEGNGSSYVRANGGPIVLDSRIDTVFVNAQGADINSVAAKISTHGIDFLIQSDQTITRNATTGAITAITPSQPAMRVTPGSTVHVHLYSLPSGNTEPAGLTTGDVWRDTSTTPNTLRIK